MADQAPEAAVLLFGDARLPRPLSGLPTHHTEGSADIAALLDALPPGHRRLVVVGDDAELATVLTRLLRTDRLDVEVALCAAPAHPRRPASTGCRPVAERPGVRDTARPVGCR